MSDEFAGFSARARNALIREGLTTIEQAIAYARSSHYSVEKMPAVGKATAREIRQKLGVPLPPKPILLPSSVRRGLRDFNDHWVRICTAYLRYHGYTVIEPTKE